MEKQLIKISEIFSSLQGEGKYAGYPMLFIRVSGCTKSCNFCDTKYHIEGKEMEIDEIIKIIQESKLDYICWTGGEPLLYREQIKRIKKETCSKKHHLETNGDLLEKQDFYHFEYIACSPKELKTAQKVGNFTQSFWNDDFDIKIVTDLDEVGKDLIPYATMLMPLNTYDSKKDSEIQRKVWQYCVDNKLKFTSRFQTQVWGQRKGV